VTNLWPNRLIGDEHLPPEYEYSDRGTSIKDIGEIKRIPDWFLQNKPSQAPASPFQPGNTTARIHRCWSRALLGRCGSGLHFDNRL